MAREHLARLNTVAVLVGLPSIYFASLGGVGGCVGPGIDLLLAGISGVLAPMWWLAIFIWTLIRPERDNTGLWRGAWRWAVAPIMSVLVLAGAKGTFLAVRLRVMDRTFVEACARADAWKAANPERVATPRETVAGIAVLHTWVADDGWYFATARSPDGEDGLFRSRNGEAPSMMPSGQEWMHTSHLTGPWWTYRWGNP